MTRRGTVLRHDILDSDTYGEMNDEQRVIWFLLILISDDWGRLPDNINKLARRIAVAQKTPEQIAETVEFLLKDGCLIRYTVDISHDSPCDPPDGIPYGAPCGVLQWTKWDEFQKRLTSRDRAWLPNQSGCYEDTTNPLGKGKNKSSGTPSDKPRGTPSGRTKDQGSSSKNQGSRREDSGKPKRQPSLSDYLEAHITLARSYFPDVSDDKLAIQVDVIEKLIRIDGYEHTEVVAIFQWLATGQDADAEFWRGVVSSFVPLRKTKEGVKCHKFENMRKAWLRVQQQGTQQTPPPVKTAQDSWSNR